MPDDPFVELAALPSLGSIRFLDARDQAAFDVGHAPGAVRVPVEKWDKAAKTADIGFTKTAYWDDALRSLGVDNSTVAVAYDDGRMTNAARVWFILQYFGAKAVVLNGGWSVLSSARASQQRLSLREAVFGRSPAQGRLAWSIGRRSSINLTVMRMCSIPERARSSLERTCAIAHAPDISQVRGICRIPISWTMALFVRHRICAS